MGAEGVIQEDASPRWPPLHLWLVFYLVMLCPRWPVARQAVVTHYPWVPDQQLQDWEGCCLRVQDDLEQPAPHTALRDGVSSETCTQP